MTGTARAAFLGELQPPGPHARPCPPGEVTLAGTLGSWGSQEASVLGAGQVLGTPHGTPAGGRHSHARCLPVLWPRLTNSLVVLTTCGQLSALQGARNKVGDREQRLHRGDSCSTLPAEAQPATPRAPLPRPPKAGLRMPALLWEGAPSAPRGSHALTVLGAGRRTRACRMRQLSLGL